MWWKSCVARSRSELDFEPLTRGDLPMLYEWLHRPHVAQWWREPPSLAGLEADYFRAEDSTRAYIVRLDGEPVGFIQSYVAMGSGDGWWEDETDPGCRGIDQFLANAQDLGRGLGGMMINAFVGQLFEDPAVTTVQTDPAPDNARAIRCYRRAGFVVQEEVNTPDGPALLMLRHRACPKGEGS
jgi:RimJ/RimL family protein N-acetyltransferase